MLLEMFEIEDPVHVYEDNTSAKYVIEGGKQQNLRWVVINAKAVLQHESLGHIKLHQVNGDEQIADTMTKPLDRSKFEKIRDLLLVNP